MNLKEQLEIYKKFKSIGQSIWLDSISRDMILNNTLSNLIEKYEITGLTSNPTIFENAILKSTTYDESIKIAAKKFRSIEDIVYSLMIEDIQRACDLLKKTFEKTNKNDGYVSIEIPPTIDETQSIIKCATKIWEMVDRENLMIKIQATKNGIKAEEELIKMGINVNMTLIFSPEVYKEVVKSYLSALKWRLENKLDGEIFSVASFFVSRIDTEVNKILTEIYTKNKDTEKRNEILLLKGKAAISVSLIAYDIYLKTFFTDEFKTYREAGYKPQKLLWASTSTKDPFLRDTLYMDELCLANTISTAPQHTIFSFFDHGKINTEDINIRIKDAYQIYEKLTKYSINWNSVFDKLLDEGIKRFIESYNNILNSVDKKIKTLETDSITIQIYNTSINDIISDLNKNNFTERLFSKDHTLWKTDPSSAKIIKNSLGWLNLPNDMQDKIEEIIHFKNEIIEEKFKYVLLLGMGGSSLAAEVIVNIFGNNDRIKLFVLDSTNPTWILRVLKHIDIEKTLFIVSSKSGTTLETISHFKYFFNLLKRKKQRPGRNFVAITDKGTPLEEIADKNDFRKIFINPSDIGGRFSVFSYFGLVPASFTSIDLYKFLNKSKEALDELKTKNPSSFILGSFIANSYLNGKDKLTIILPKKLERFGLWIEQLIAESTGKEGKGIIPIIDTEIYDVESYSNDRCFVVINLKNFKENEEKIDLLIKKGHPLLRIFLTDIYDIAKEFYRWEIATSICGHIMKINPFDQPDVQFTKDFTKKILSTKKDELKPNIKNRDWEVYLANIKHEDNSILWNTINNIKENGYIAICAYLDENEKTKSILNKLKKLLTERLSIPTISVYGPRYLHSIGQLFKGGKNSGTFLILTSKPKKDIKIIGEDLSFNRICLSQAKGDFMAMKEKGRACIMINEKKEFSFIKGVLKEIEFLTDSKEKTEGNSMPKAVAKKNKKQPNKTNESYVVIDYPKHLETITSPHYTIRIGASPTNKVEVSIDGGPWMSARESVGYWWYDWNNITPGTHEIIARIQVGDSYITSKRRRCKAVL